MSGDARTVVIQWSMLRVQLESDRGALVSIVIKEGIYLVLWRRAVLTRIRSAIKGLDHVYQMSLLQFEALLDPLCIPSGLVSVCMNRGDSRTSNSGLPGGR